MTTMQPTSTPDADGQEHDQGARVARGRRVLAGVIALALAAVIVAPIALSSGDLVAWAASPQGLGLGGAWPLVVFVALDAAAAVCVGFVLFSAWRGEGAGAFGLLVWLFAAGSALANYQHGRRTPAPDDAVFFAAMSIAGPVLLHVTLHRVRRWVRIADGDYRPARAHFGLRWLPGVAFGETLAAWKTSVRAGISRPELAVAQVRQRRLLASLEEPERIRFAVGALGGRPGLHELRVWLADRGQLVATDALERTLGTHAATLARTDQPPAVLPVRRALPARPPDARTQRANAPRADRAQHGNAALRERVAATYAQLLAAGQVTPDLRSLRVAELIRQRAGLRQSARTLERYVQELRRQPAPPPLPEAGSAPASGAVPEPAHQPPAAVSEGLRLVGDRSTPTTTAEPAIPPADPAAQHELRTS